MVNKKAKGARSKTRDLFKNKKRITVNKLLDQFKAGDRVAIKINSSFHSGLPNKRYHGKTGQVMGKKGKAYVVDVMLGNALMTLTVSPAHLHIVGGSNK